MALITEILKQAIIQAGKDARGEDDLDKANEKFADSLATAIDDYIKSGDVNTTVNTTGTAAAQVGTGKGKIT